MSHRILVLPFPLLSHYLRCLTLLRGLQGRYDIRFAGNCKAAAHAEKEGFALVPVDQFDTGEALRDSQNFTFDWLSPENIGRVLKGYIQAIESEKPDLILSDSAQVARMAAEITGVRHVALLNGYLARSYALVRGIPENHPAKRFEQQTPPKIFDAILRGAEGVAMNKVHLPFRNLRRELRLPMTEHYLDEFRGNITCLCDPESIFPQKPLQGAYSDYRVIGPAYYEEPDKSAEASSSTARPLIFVTMGSSGNWAEAKLLLGPEFREFDIVFSGNDPGFPTQENVQIVPFVRPSDILPKASAVICHGGNGTIYQALSYGVPVLGRPSQFEQEWNVQRFGALNLIWRIPATVTAPALKELLTRAIMERPTLQQTLSGYDLSLPPTIQRFHKAVDTLLT